MSELIGKNIDELEVWNKDELEEYILENGVVSSVHSDHILGPSMKNMYGDKEYNIRRTIILGDYYSISCGVYHCTALKEDGTLISWGRDNYNQVSDTPKDDEYIQVSCGYFHCTALKEDGTLISWGRDSEKQVSNTPKDSGFIQVSCGQYHCTALKEDGTLVSWGRDSEKQVSNTPKDDGYIQVSCGYFHCTALKEDGTLVSWGYNNYNQVSDTPKDDEYIQVSCGRYHCTAIKEDGTLVSWGYNTYKQVSDTPKDDGYIYISCGMYHCIALKEDGTLVSWGRNSNNEVSDTPKGNGYIQVSCGEYHCTAVKEDGTLVSWGYNNYNQVSNTPKDDGYISSMRGIVYGGIRINKYDEYIKLYDKESDIHLYKTHPFYISKDDIVYDIDVLPLISDKSNKIISLDNPYSINGNVRAHILLNSKVIPNTSIDIEAPRVIEYDNNAQGIRAPLKHIMESSNVNKTDNGYILSIPSDNMGSIDILDIDGIDNEYFESYSKADMINIEEDIIMDISITPRSRSRVPIYMEMKSSAYDRDMRIELIDSYSKEHIAYVDIPSHKNGDYIRIPLPVSDGNISVLFTGDEDEPYNITDITIYYSGIDIKYGQDTSIKINGYDNILSCGTSHCTVLKENGTLVSWGINNNNVVSNTPKGNDFIQVSCGYYHATALKEDGTLVSWGLDNYNQVSDTPKDSGYIQVSCGTYHCTALKEDGTLVSWGSDNYNQVSDTPKDSGYIQVSCGTYHITALKEDGTLVSWGNNNHNQVSNTPKGNDFIQVSCGHYHCTALKEDGTLVSWGYNNENVVSTTPKDSGYIQVSCGNYHCTALKEDGTLVSWGYNSSNQVSTTPKDSGYIQISCGGYHCTALKEDGTLVSWGWNNHNQVSNTPKGIIYPHTKKIYSSISEEEIDYIEDSQDIFNMLATPNIILKNIKYNIIDRESLDKYNINIGDLYLGMGTNSIINSKIPLEYTHLKSSDSMWTDIGNDIISGELYKKDLIVNSTNKEVIRSFDLVYGANIGPIMRDFDISLDNIHEEHTVIKGEVVDPEGENIEIVTKIQTPKETIEDTIEVGPSYTYQKALSFEDNLDVGVNTITITVTDPRGKSSTWSTKVTVHNEKPFSVVTVYNNNYISSIVRDVDGDKAMIEYYNTTTGEQLEESMFMDVPFAYKYVFRPGDTEFDKRNNIRVTFTDEFGESTSITCSVHGIYRSIMFVDEDGNYYTDDQGKIIKPLDFGMMRSGRETEATFKIVNNTSYDLDKLTLTAFGSDRHTLPEGCRVYLAIDDIEPDWKEDKLVLPGVFKNNDEANIVMKVSVPDKSVQLGAKFGVDASGTILLNRAGIEDSEAIEMKKRGYKIK